MNSNTQSYLNYYCKLPTSHAPGYAVMVSGNWGCVKTYLVKQVLCKGKEDKIPHLYVSLYGMSSVSEIGDALFQELHPLRSSSLVRFLSKVGKGLLKGTIKIDLDDDGKLDGSLSPDLSVFSLPKDFKIADKRILIFDDIERSDIRIANVLGYINYFVKHEGCKVIVIANEAEIDDDKGAYSRIKEKLVGKTLVVKPDFASALRHFIGLVDNDTLRDRAWVQQSQDTIGELFWKSQANNLRILRTTLWDFERFVDSLSKELQEHNQLMEKLLSIFLALSFELKLARLPAEKLQHFDAYADMEIIDAIEKRYRYGLFDDSVLSFKLWAQVLVDGTLDKRIQPTLPIWRAFHQAEITQ